MYNTKRCTVLLENIFRKTGSKYQYLNTKYPVRLKLSHRIQLKLIKDHKYINFRSSGEVSRKL